MPDCRPLDVTVQWQPDGTARVFIRTDLPPEDVWRELAQGVSVKDHPHLTPAHHSHGDPRA